MGVRLLWNDRLRRAAERLREPDILFRPDQPGQANTPYLTKEILEDWFVEIGNQLLRECTLMELEAVGSVALKKQALTSQVFALPRNLIDVINVQIDGCVSVQVSPTKFAMVGTAIPQARARFWTIVGTSILYRGTNAQAYLLTEPTLEDWQSDKPILPGSKDEEMITYATQMAALTDSLPEGVVG